jgi:hypothetical protein
VARPGQDAVGEDGVGAGHGPGRRHGGHQRRHAVGRPRARARARAHRRAPYLKGAPDMYDGGVLTTVDVGFLADAHVVAYESPTAYDRYLCFSNAVCRPEDAVKLAQMLSPTPPRSSPPR